MNNIDTLDLTSKPLILGTGLTAISIASVFQDAKKDFYIIDAGFENNNLASDKEIKKFTDKFASPKLSSKYESFAFMESPMKFDIEEDNFASIRSLAAGGLSNIWGGGISPYNKEELSRIYSRQRMNIVERAYKKINSIIHEGNRLGFKTIDEYQATYPEIALNSACLSVFKNQDSNNSLQFTLPLNALCRTDAKEDYKKLQDSWMGDFKTLTIFNSRLLLEKIKKKHPESYIKNIYIESIKKIGDIYFIYCLNLLTNKKLLIKSKNVFCCLGVISTTKLALEMEQKFNQKHQLLNTPAASFLSFCYSKKYIAGNFSLNNLSFEININNQVISGGFFPLTFNLFEKISTNWMLPRIFKKILHRLIFSRVLIANVFFPSDFSENSINLTEENKIIIYGKNKSFEIKKLYSEILKILKNNLTKEKIIVLPFLQKILRPGEDIHYGGTISNINDNKNLCCIEDGSLVNNKNFYICDSSSMPYLSGKPHSFNAMVNAAVIAIEYLSKN